MAQPGFPKVAFFFFFFLHCRASTGHGRSTLEMYESTKGETGIACRSLFTGEKAKTTTKTKQKTGQANKKTTKASSSQKW